MWPNWRPYRLLQSLQNGRERSKTVWHLKNLNTTLSDDLVMEFAQEKGKLVLKDFATHSVRSDFIYTNCKPQTVKYCQQKHGKKWWHHLILGDHTATSKNKARNRNMDRSQNPDGK